MKRSIIKINESEFISDLRKISISDKYSSYLSMISQSLEIENLDFNLNDDDDLFEYERLIDFRKLINKMNKWANQSIFNYHQILYYLISIDQESDSIDLFNLNERDQLKDFSDFQSQIILEFEKEIHSEYIDFIKYLKNLKSE